jgi:type IV secretory pathway VirB10-like protein
MTIPRNARAGFRALLLAAPAAILLLSACDSREGAGAGSGTTTQGVADGAAPEVATPAATPAVATPTQAAPMQAAGHEGHDHAHDDGHVHAGHDDGHGHDHAGHDHDHKSPALEEARAQAEKAARALANAVANSAPQNVQDDLTARADQAQRLYEAAARAAESRPTCCAPTRARGSSCPSATSATTWAS